MQNKMEPPTGAKHEDAMQQVVALLRRNGMEPTTEPTEQGVSHHLKVRYPVGGETIVHVVRPERPLQVTVFVTATNVSPQHEEALLKASKERRVQVAREVRRTAFQGGRIGYGPRIEGDLLKGWRLDIEIADDGLTDHNVRTSLRALLTKHLEMIDTFNEALGAPANGQVGGATGSTGYL